MVQCRSLERVLEMNSTTNIAAVNMSLGGGQFTANCDATDAAAKTAIDNLRSVNIATVIASGNSSYTNALGSPACISTAVKRRFDRRRQRRRVSRLRFQFFKQRDFSQLVGSGIANSFIAAEQRFR